MTDHAPEDQPTEPVHVDRGSFNYSERMEMQREFGTDFADLYDYVVRIYRRKSDADIDTTVKVRDGEGRIRFADEILRHAVWIVRRRTDPEAKLTDFDDDGIAPSYSFLRRRPGKPTPTNSKPRKT